MSGIEFITVAIVAGTFISTISAIQSHKRKELELKHQTYRELIESGKLDADTLERVLAGIEGRRPRRQQPELASQSVLLKLSFIAGWIALFVGIALFIAGIASHDRDLPPAGMIVGLIGLGLASMPVAWREIQGRAREADSQP